jgi:hypothetical protein
MIFLVLCKNYKKEPQILEIIAASFFLVVFSNDRVRDESVSKFLRNVSKLSEFQQGEYRCENIGDIMTLVWLEGCSSRRVREPGLTSLRLHHIGFNLGAGDRVGDEGGVV